MCSSASAPPQVSRKMQIGLSQAEPGRQRPSNICTNTSPMSRADPLVEDLDQEASPLLGADRPVGHLGSRLPLAGLARLVDPLDDRDQLDVASAELVADEAVDVEPVVAVGGSGRR